MSTKSIFLFAPAEVSTVTSGPVACAIALAKAHGARLTVFCVALDVTTPGQHADHTALAATILAQSDAAGVDAVAVTEHSHAIGVHEVIAEHARLHDLCVIGNSAASLLNERMIAEHLLFESGRPVLMVPRDWHGTADWQNVVAAWDHSRAAARALGDALAVFGPSAVTFLAIEGDKMFGSDLELDQFRHLAERRGFAADFVTAERGDRDIASALQQEAVQGGGQLLVMGAFGHNRMRSFILGSATAGILQQLQMPVLLSH